MIRVASVVFLLILVSSTATSEPDFAWRFERFNQRYNDFVIEYYACEPMPAVNREAALVFVDCNPSGGTFNIAKFGRLEKAASKLFRGL